MIWLMTYCEASVHYVEFNKRLDGMSYPLIVSILI